VEGRPGQDAPPPAAAPQRTRELSWLAILGIVLLFVLFGHVQSVWTGLYLDDYAHYEHLKDGNWSYKSAVDAARLGIVGEVLDLWGRQEAGLRFYRPIAFWIMRAEYTLVHWNPMGMHALSLLWHTACSMLVGVIATCCLGRRFWGLVAACLMAVHPTHVGTVYWIACQTELLTTLFLLVGVLAYAKYAGWPTPWFAERVSGIGCRASGIEEPTQTPVQANSTRAPTPDPRNPSPDTRSPIYALVAILCYALALGCRENAALFPLVCWLGDRLIGTSRRGWLRWDHVAMGCVFVLYMGLRWQALGGFPVPPPPYLQPVSASAEFVQYVVYKSVTYVLGLFAFMPIVPVGGRSYFSERPTVFYEVFAAVVALLMIVWWAYGFRRALLWPIVWMGALIAPIMLVFASPHHLYLPALGMVLPATAGLAAIAGHHRNSPVRLARLRYVLSSVVLLAGTLAIAGLTWCMEFTYVRGVLSEDLVVRDVLRQDRPLRDGDHLFFINLPVLAYYAVPAIEEELNYRSLRGHVLVFSPDLVYMESPSTVEVVDRHHLRIRVPEGKRYLSGTTGTMLLGVMGIDAKLTRGQQMDAGEFKATIADLDAGGVKELLFEFAKPIDSPEYHFYLGSPQFMAREMRFPSEPQAHSSRR
jgi:hypothetical protein